MSVSVWWVTPQGLFTGRSDKAASTDSIELGVVGLAQSITTPLVGKHVNTGPGRNSILLNKELDESIVDFGMKPPIISTIKLSHRLALTNNIGSNSEAFVLVGVVATLAVAAAISRRMTLARRPLPGSILLDILVGSEDGGGVYSGGSISSLLVRVAKFISRPRVDVAILSLRQSKGVRLDNGLLPILLSGIVIAIALYISHHGVTHRALTISGVLETNPLCISRVSPNGMGRTLAKRMHSGTVEARFFRLSSENVLENSRRRNSDERSDGLLA